jgi:hypothetical protein
MTAEEENQDGSTLQKEIKSWNDYFRYALREKNRILFNQMHSLQKRDASSSQEENCKT